MYKPFIQLFKTPNRKYFYEPNKNEFVVISDDSYNYLCDLLNNNISSDLPVPEEINELISQGYLSEKPAVEEIIHPYTKYIRTMLSRKISKITLQLTQQCNFRCKYCIYSENINQQQRSHSNNKMSWETAQKAIDFLWHHSVDSDSIDIGFYGGEPLLEFPMIKKAVAYSKKIFKGKDLTFSITSNGTLLTEDIIQFFADHDVHLMISLDGPKEINDLNRVFANGQGTYDAVMKNIELIKSVNKEYAKNVKYSMVINPENDFDCINSVHVDSKAIDKWNIIASLVDKDYDSESVNFSENYSYKYEYHKFLAALAHFNQISKDVVSPIVYTAFKTLADDNDKMISMSAISPYDAPGGPCIPGQLRLFSDYQGNLYPCERVSETSPVMQIGNIYDGFNYDKVVHLLNIGRLTENQCKHCWAFKYCSICAKAADNGTELSVSKKLAHCEDTKAAAYEKLYTFLALREFRELYGKYLRKN